jgi:cation diffusion facilitator CzcD-associated flavoprotein CzcO
MSKSTPHREKQTSATNRTQHASQLDAIIIGAGISGLYALHCLRSAGLSVRAFDAAGGVGGTWWWTRYPGARVDFPGGPFYCYTFSEDLVREFDWPETHPDQATVLAYVNFVADKLDLRRDIQLETSITGAIYNAASQRWDVETGNGARFSAQYLICAVGSLSAVNNPSIRGLETFAGDCFHTARWPHDAALAGKRVGVIGTGSSAVQSIPVMAREAEHLMVFQRTPQYVIPAGNRPIDPEVVRHARENWPQIRKQMMNSILGSPFPRSTRSALDDTEEQRRETYEARWQLGGQGILFYTYGDLMVDRAANQTLCEFVRGKIREIVHKPEVVKKLLPDYDLGTKRLVLDTNYYATFNRDNVELIDLREDPIITITPTGVRTQSGEHPLDVLVLATGFDALSGAFRRLNPRGRDGVALADKWVNRFSTYLGMAIHGFPNLFMIQGPETPSVLWNMPFAAELEADWIRDCILHLREHHIGAIEPAAGVEDDWGREVDSIANQTLFPQNDSWFTGSNIPGKPRQFAIHLNGPEYFKRLDKVASDNYPGFVLEPARKTSVSLSG